MNKAEAKAALEAVDTFLDSVNDAPNPPTPEPSPDFAEIERALNKMLEAVDVLHAILHSAEPANAETAPSASGAPTVTEGATETPSTDAAPTVSGDSTDGANPSTPMN